MVPYFILRTGLFLQKVFGLLGNYVHSLSHFLQCQLFYLKSPEL